MIDRYLKFYVAFNDEYYLPLRNLKGMHPTADTRIRMYFNNSSEGDMPGTGSLYAEIGVSSGESINVITEIYQNISASEDIIISIKDLSSSIGSVASLAITASKDSSLGWHGSSTRIKILPSDFIADDGGRPVQIDDTGSDRWVESYTTFPMYASVSIPTGFEATECAIYGSGTSAITVYEANISGKTVTSKATGNIGTPITGASFTNVASDGTNYLLIELVQAIGEEVYGGYVTIATS